jgi:hypothetical protein
MSYFKPTPQNADELQGFIKGIIHFDKYTFHDNLNPYFEITQNKDEFTIDFQYSDHMDKHGESNVVKDSFTVNFEKDPAASLSLIIAMLDEMYNADVHIEPQINH